MAASGGGHLGGGGGHLGVVEGILAAVADILLHQAVEGISVDVVAEAGRRMVLATVSVGVGLALVRRASGARFFRHRHLRVFVFGGAGWIWCDDPRWWYSPWWWDYCGYY